MKYLNKVFVRCKMLNQCISTVIAIIPTLMYGIQVGWMSPMTPILQSICMTPASAPLTDYDISWMAAVICLTAIIGVPLFGFIADTYGRKPAIVLLSIPQAISWMLIVYSSEPPFLITARAFAGLSAGGGLMIVPMFIREISTDDFRGSLASLVTLSCSSGLTLGYILGAALSYGMVLCVLTPLPLIHAVISTFGSPETPAFLVKKEKFEEATTCLAWLRSLPEDSKEVLEELEKLKEDKVRASLAKKITIKRIAGDKGTMRAFRASMVLMLIQTLSGCYVVVTYAGVILDAGGAMSPNLFAVAIGIVQIAGSLMATVTVERFGRKMLMSSSCIMVSMSMLSLGVWFYLAHVTKMPLPSWIPLVSVATCIFCNAAGVTPVPFVFISEVFSFQLRTILLSVIMIMMWFNQSVMLWSFKPIVNAFGLHVAFFTFSTIQMVGGIYTMLCIPETKGKTLEEIHSELGCEKSETCIEEKYTQTYFM